jgi:hypothetical protein
LLEPFPLHQRMQLAGHSFIPLSTIAYALIGPYPTRGK